MVPKKQNTRNGNGNNNNKSKSIGSKREVWHGYALKTKEGWTKQYLYINNNNKISHKPYRQVGASGQANILAPGQANILVPDLSEISNCICGQTKWDEGVSDGSCRTRWSNIPGTQIREGVKLLHNRDMECFGWGGLPCQTFNEFGAYTPTNDQRYSPKCKISSSLDTNNKNICGNKHQWAKQKGYFTLRERSPPPYPMAIQLPTSSTNQIMTYPLPQTNIPPPVYSSTFPNPPNISSSYMPLPPGNQGNQSNQLPPPPMAYSKPPNYYTPVPKSHLQRMTGNWNHIGKSQSQNWGHMKLGNKGHQTINNWSHIWGQ